MNKEKLKIYTLEIILIVILFLALFESNIVTRLVLATFLAIYMVITVFTLKKRNLLSIYHKQVTILMFAFGVIYLIIFYLMGLYFGYYDATVKFSLWTVITYILPISAIIIASEVIRYVFISQKGRFTKVGIFIAMVLVDLIIYIGAYDVTKLEDLLAVVGNILFASISCNLLYNYVSSRYGYKSVIIYRLITVLYIYIIPIIPNVFIFLRSFLRMLYPYLIYMVLDYTYSRTTYAVSYKSKTRNTVITAVWIIILVMIIMLISCQFRYGILVVGSGSMTGAINKGDAVVFESYHDQEIQVGDVIIFTKDNTTQLIHRVVKITNVNNEIRYITKGDANQNIDQGYITNEQINGVTLFRIKYIGYPTIWVRDIFTKEGG